MYGHHVHEAVKAAVEQTGEENYTTANKLVEPSENQACYYTLTSVKSGVPGGEVRSSVVEFASQFIGNPYVWGGTSLTDGADCSGFVQSVYAHFGVSLPRTTYEMVNAGYAVSYEDAMPGDLILYNGHVGLYMGDGNIVNAMNPEKGIGICSATYAQIISVRRVL